MKWAAVSKNSRRCGRVGGQSRSGRGGGRTWWAHLKFSRINIELTIPNKIEELMNVKAIGEKSVLKLKPLITVGDSKPATHQ